MGSLTGQKNTFLQTSFWVDPPNADKWSAVLMFAFTAKRSLYSEIIQSYLELRSITKFTYFYERIFNWLKYVQYWSSLNP